MRNLFKIIDNLKRNKIVHKVYGFIKKYPFYIILGILLLIYTYQTVSVFYHINSYISDEVWYAPASYNIMTKIFHLNINQTVSFPSGKELADYFNLEHPPLAKYIIGIFIYFLGYDYWVWRIPSWILGNLIIVLSFLITRKIVGNNIFGNVAGIIASVLIMSDPNMWIMHGIAMLDIYVSFFSLLSLYYLIKDDIQKSSISFGLSFSSKFSGAFLIFPFLYYVRKVDISRIKRFFYVIILPLLIYLSLNIPLIIYFGFSNWFNKGFLDALEWGITSGHIVNAPNQISLPWQWLLNIHPFYLGAYSGNDLYLNNFYASVNNYFMILWLILTPLVFILKDKKVTVSYLYPLSIYLGFFLIYMLGNDTLFTFYVADFMPMVYVYIVSSLFLLGLRYYKREIDV
ncbi:MAG: glycosyltransferase family 39 protein [Candidatus Nanopusillus sp.]